MANEHNHDERIQARRLILLQYCARLQPRHTLFRWPDDDELVSIQEFLYEDLRLDEEGGGDDGYKRSFLKELLARLERHFEANRDDQDAEVAGDLLEAYADLLSTSSSSSSSQPAPLTVTRFIRAVGGNSLDYHRLLPGLRPIRTKEEGTTISRGTTGLKTWEASLRLAGHLVAHPEILQSVKSDGKRRPAVLELGCGTGFLGLVASAALSSSDVRVVLSDLEGEVLEHARESVEANADRFASIEVQPLNWIEVQECAKEPCDLLDGLAPSLVLAADIVFDPTLVGPLCAVLQRILVKTPGSMAYVASTVRNEETFALFVETLATCDLMAERIKVDESMLDLQTLSITPALELKPHCGHRALPLFLSTHSSSLDGQVCILRVTCAD